MHYHNIETTNEAPVKSKRFQYSPKMQEVIETQIKNLKENDIIEESMSPYHSSVILVNQSAKALPGTQNQNADALSRRDYPVDSQDMEYQSDDDLPEIGSLHAALKEHTAITFEFGWEDNATIPEVLTIDNDQVKDPDEMLPTRQTLYQLQRNCPDFKPIFDFKLKELVPDDAQKERFLVAKAYLYEIIEGILYHMVSENSRKLPPGNNFLKQLCILLDAEEQNVEENTIDHGGQPELQIDNNQSQNNSQTNDQNENVSQHKVSQS
ncbi:unnamed protein product [Mytilus coruscus]|uniref:Uncharacterized protein n=1 Tax=Mytilus coruscus TaxID=42192 RepID=A0A6J8EIK1_MYTCO|nr:unnamed protein product [Mytilus coruscus]